MNKQDVITFFDRYAPTWDADQVDRSAAIEQILNNARIGRGQKVLDVACGTGILFPYYLKREAAQLIGVDISPKMAHLAAEKFADDPRVRVLCGDVEELLLPHDFDHVVVYNAFPHFPDPARLIATLARRLQDGGRLTIAHGMSRDTINAHHQGAARYVSHGLMSAAELAALFAPHFAVDVQVDSEQFYQVSGIKK